MITKDKLMRIKIIDDLLIRKLYPSKQDIIDAIYDKLMDLYGDEKKANISPSTIEKDLKDMRYNSVMFKNTAEIMYSAKEEGYYYVEDNFSILNNPLNPDEKAAIEILLEFFKDQPVFEHMQDSINNILASIKIPKEKQEQIIQFDKSIDYKGSKFLPIITKSINERKKISFLYNKYFSDNINERIVEPYFLKEYGKRWYLFAYWKQEYGVRIYELSRISDLKVLDETYIMDKTFFNPKQYLEYTYGVTPIEDSEPQDIILQFTYEEGKFIETSSLHPTQKKIKETKDHLTYQFKLQFAERSYELIRFVCKFSNNVKVIKPDSLKQEVLWRLKETIEQYEE